MGRHALVYRNQRQRWFARKIASRQPLVAHMARHQRLLRELVLTDGRSERMGILAERDFNRTGQRALPLARPLFRPLLVGEAEEEHVFSTVPSPVPDRLLAGQYEEDPGQEATIALTAANTMDRAEIESASLPDKPEKVSSQQEVHVESVDQFLEVGGQELATINRLPETQMNEPLEVYDQDLLLDQQIMESAAASDRSPEAGSAHLENTDQSPGIIEPIEAKLQQQQKIVDERSQTIESAKTRRSRGRIQEQPAEPGNTSPAQAAPPSPPTRMARRKEQEMVSKEASSKKASEADELFAPRDTDRSPQTWMARLMGAKSVPHNDMVAVSTTVEARSVTGEQPESGQQPAGSDQFKPPARQGRFAPANEGPSREVYYETRREEPSSRRGGGGWDEGRGRLRRPWRGDQATGNRDEGDATTQGVPTLHHPSPVPTGTQTPPGHHEENFIVKANEGPVTVTPQTDKGRRLKADSQPLPAAKTNVVRDTSEARPASTPLSQRTRQFLQPLVGIDPASVHVQRDAIAEHLTDAYQADAITIGDDVAMAAGHPDDTPETLGLLAHEFTHVARRREPRFVPPIARVMDSASTNASMPGNVTPGRLPAPTDEEALAQRVEGRVTRAAQEKTDQATALSMTPSSGGLVAGATRPIPESGSARDSWGGLPAPWEPLPAWLMSLPAPEDGGANATSVPSRSSQVAHGMGGAENGISGVSGVSGGYGGGGTWNGGGPGDTGVQRAGLERSPGEEEQTTASMQQPAADTTKAPEPDLDALARQVYTLLKQRLEVERRRGS